MDKETHDKVKEFAMVQSMETLDIYRGLLDSLEKDLKTEGNESLQQAAALAIRTFHLFITQEEGYKTWNKALHNLIKQELMAHNNITAIH